MIDKVIQVCAMDIVLRLNEGDLKSIEAKTKAIREILTRHVDVIQKEERFSITKQITETLKSINNIE